MSVSVNGKIVKGIAGFYYVYVEGLGIVTCKAKGLFRNNKVKPLPGDMVLIDIIDSEKSTGNIVDILPRKNELIRPAVANIDQAMVIFAVAEPEPHLNLLDRFLILMERQKIPVIIVFNKTDLAEESKSAYLRQIYEKGGYKTLAICAEQALGMEDVRGLLDRKTTVLAGPSGVGKSTFMNFIQPEAQMQTGMVSEKIKRGKHTTRHTELVYVSEETFLIDTPGFSSLYINEIDESELQDYYPEFTDLKNNCRFVGCSHIKEPDCAVKEAVASKRISLERYENYCKLYSEASSRKRY